MPTRPGTGQIVCIHDALSREDIGGIYGPRRVSGKYEFSLEMAEFLTRYERGTWEATETDLRCYGIATRKGCYQEQLIDAGFDNLTDTGNDAALDARIISVKMIQYYARRGVTHFDYTKATTMDEIVPYGFPQSQSIFLLAALISHLPVDEHPKYMKDVASRIKAWNMNTTIVEGKEYLLVGSIRNNTISRNAGNQLLKLGLANIINLPKTKESKGRGRAPVGMYVSEMGIRFYADYLQEFSQNARYERKIFGPDEAPKINTSSSFADFTEYGQKLLARPAMGPPIEADQSDTDSTYDPNALENQKWDIIEEPDERYMPPKAPISPKSGTSHIPDVIAGENLKDLFG